MWPFGYKAHHERSYKKDGLPLNDTFLSKCEMAEMVTVSQVESSVAASQSAAVFLLKSKAMYICTVIWDYWRVKCLAITLLASFKFDDTW